MRLRTFSAASMSEAMRLVREELGPDAVILSTETQGRSVKLTAALDRAAMIEPAPLPMDEPLDTISAVLDFHRIPNPLSDRLVNIATNFLLENPRQALGAALRARFSYSSILEKRPERPIMLVGLPGAGKTSTLAKLAAGAKLANWPVVAITCDLAKAGGIDQLAIYAKALQITAYQAKNAASLKRAVAAAPDNALILIDTAGANPLRPEELSELAELATAAKAEPVPVFAAGGDVAESAEQGQLFSEIGCQRLIATRIDAARRYGGILAAADAGQLALAEFGVSPEIAKGLMFFGADALARLLMPQEMAKPRKTAQNTDQPRFGFGGHAPPEPPPSLGKARKRPLESKS
jgi:flagellar biosynthesis protein FlhF